MIMTFVKKGAVINIGSNGQINSRHVYDPYVLNVNGEFWMWHNICSEEVGRIALSTSRDGVNWINKGIIRPLGSSKEVDNYYIYTNCVQHINDEFWMWYSGQDNSSNHHYRIFLATSKDGVNWIKKGVVLNIGITGEIYDHTCCVLGVNSEFWMWYGDLSGEKYNTSLAISKDGVNWTKKGAVLTTGDFGSIDEKRAYKAKLLHIDGRFWMWYAAVDSNGTNRIALAISKSGL